MPQGSAAVLTCMWGAGAGGAAVRVRVGALRVPPWRAEPADHHRWHGAELRRQQQHQPAGAAGCARGCLFLQRSSQ